MDSLIPCKTIGSFFISKAKLAINGRSPIWSKCACDTMILSINANSFKLRTSVAVPQSRRSFPSTKKAVGLELLPLLPPQPSILIRIFYPCSLNSDMDLNPYSNLNAFILSAEEHDGTLYTPCVKSQDSH